jgi:hypothetical protein
MLVIRNIIFPTNVLYAVVPPLVYELVLVGSISNIRI